MKDYYSMIAQWSERDSRYIAFVPELPGCFADGETLEEATQQLVLALRDWLETAKELGMDIPPAVSAEDAQKQNIELSRRQGEEINRLIEAKVREFAQSFQEGIAEGLTETLRENLFENDEWRNRLLSLWAQSGKLAENTVAVIGLVPSGVSSGTVLSHNPSRRRLAPKIGKVRSPT